MYTIFAGKPGWHMFCAGLLLTMLSHSGSGGGSSQQAEGAKNSNAASVNSRMNTNLRNPNETWGGDHVRLVTKPGGGDLEFDCAHGDLTEELKPDADGNFDIAGTFSREGGPTRSDEKSNGRAVRYVGRITQNSMTIQITFKDSNETSETFTLTRGSEGRLRKCR
ncbi:MAG TPA: hypothetical protein VJ372_11420 [Pyrinomonadaceae bacterium]|jgi:hypothetical protein|nr:hypothetical protein [Pyrinomonadaceae bacterium]